MDILTIIVGILSILVTVLIGWNIFYALNFKKEMLSKISKIQEDCQDKIKQYSESSRIEIEKIKKEFERKEYELKQFEQETNNNTIRLIHDSYRLFATINKEFALIYRHNFVNTPNENDLYNIVNHFIYAIINHANIWEYREADEIIDLLIKNIPKNIYNILKPEHKKSISENIKLIKEPNKLKNYNKLSGYIYSEDNENDSNK